MNTRIALSVGGFVLALGLAGCASTAHGHATSGGSTQTVNDGTGDTVQVTLLKFGDPATPAAHAAAPPAGDDLAKVRFKVAGATGKFQFNADIAIAMVGSDHQVYAAGSQHVVGCSAFPAGQLTVTPGHSITGCVAVPIKKGVAVKEIEFDGGYVGSTGTWPP